ncbi:MAG: acyloxyacyl hydrolase [Bacteroidota bacterium]
MFLRFVNTTIFILCNTFVIAQNGITGSKNFYLKVAPTYGFIFEQRRIIGNLVKGYIPGFELDIVKPTYGNKKWHKENNFPEVGLSLNFIDYSNPKQLGYCFGLSPFIDFPLKQKDKKSRLYLRVCWGVSYLTKHYDVNTNPKNIAIGSAFNTYVQFKWFWHFNINEKIRLEPGFSFAHSSNGRAAVPNLGLNVVSLNLGITYKFKNDPVISPLQDSAGLWESKHELLIWDAVGFNEHEPPNGPKYFANTFGINYYYNKKNTHKFGAGFDVCYDTQNEYHLQTSNNPSNGWTDLLQLGVKLCYAYNVGRVSLPVEMGYYAISKPKEDGPIFHRIGIRYYCKNGLMYNFSLKSHWAVAAHFDYGIGYRFKLRKKKNIGN